MQKLESANTMLTADNPRGGVNVFFDLSAKVPLQQSPCWSAAGRVLQIFRLAPGQTLTLAPGDHYVKVVLGALINIDRTCLAPPFTVRPTRVPTSELLAGDDGALFVLMTLAADAPRRLTNMAALRFAGPLAEYLAWQRFDAKFAGRTDFFDGKDCYMADGIHVLDGQGIEVVYINPWTCGKGVDLSTHNHAHAPSPRAPAFAEVHWVLAASTDNSGMYRTPQPDAAERTRYVMQLGDEHGPFYDRDPLGRPRLRDNGAVQYPWHGWQGGEDEMPGPAYDFVAAFEINPDYIEASR